MEKKSSLICKQGPVRQSSRLLATWVRVVYFFFLSFFCEFFDPFLLFCRQKKDTGNTKRLIEKHIFSSNRNKIQVDQVKQLFLNRKLRVLWGSDNPSTTLVVSHVIGSRWFGQRYLLHAPPNGQVRHKAFLKVSPGTGPEPTRARHFRKYLEPR